MLKRAGFTFFLLTMLVVSFIGSAEVAKASTQQIPKVMITIPVSVEEAVQSEIVEKLTSMAAHGIVYLDLTIGYRRGVDGAPPFSLMVNGKPRKADLDSIGHGPLWMARGAVYHMGPIAGYNHLLMSVYTGDRSVFPFNDVSLEYSATDNTLALFHVRGFFYVLSNAIPTAIGLQLRPINPPFELARKVLMGK